MCNGIWEFHTGNMRVSVWGGQRVATCFVPYFFFYFVFFLFLPFSSLSCGFYVDNICTLRGFYELTQAWPIISVSLPNTHPYHE